MPANKPETKIETNVSFNSAINTEVGAMPGEAEDIADWIKRRLEFTEAVAISLWVDASQKHREIAIDFYRRRRDQNK